VLVGTLRDPLQDKGLHPMSDWGSRRLGTFAHPGSIRSCLKEQAAHRLDTDHSVMIIGTEDARVLVLAAVVDIVRDGSHHGRCCLGLECRLACRGVVWPK
jgi:hypothetical protein